MNPKPFSANNIRCCYTHANRHLCNISAWNSPLFTHQFWQKLLITSCTITLLLTLLTNTSAQPARPCDCSVYNVIGVTGETHDISEYDPLSTNRCHFLKGTITIAGADPEWTGLRIKMEESSQIFVSTGLTIINCHISGCDDMWKGIKTD